MQRLTHREMAFADLQENRPSAGAGAVGFFGCFLVTFFLVTLFPFKNRRVLSEKELRMHTVSGSEVTFGVKVLLVGGRFGLESSNLIKKLKRATRSFGHPPSFSHQMRYVYVGSEASVGMNEPEKHANGSEKLPFVPSVPVGSGSIPSWVIDDRWK